MRKNLSFIKDSLKAMWQLDRTVVITALITSVISAVIPYAGILLPAYIIDELALGTKILPLIKVSLFAVSGAFLLSILNSYLKQIFQVHISICRRKFDMRMSERTLTMDYELLESPKVNEIRTRMKNDETWGDGFSTMIYGLPQLLNCFIGLITSILVLIPLFFTKSLFQNRPTIILLVLFLITLIGNGIFASKNKAKFNSLLSTVNFHNSYKGHFLFNGIDYKYGKDIRIYNAQPLIKRYLDKDQSWNTDSIVKCNSEDGFVTGLSSGLLMTLSYLFVVLRAISGAFGIGSVAKYAATIYRFSSQLNNTIVIFSEYAAAAQRQQSTLEYMNIPDVLYKGSLPVEKRTDNEYEIEFRNVSFKYPGSENYVLKNLNLKLNVGKRLAVVGMNGSGKTTMIKLLCRLYDPTEGEILLNGINIQNFRAEEYRNIFSVVFQDFKLFAFTLGENVAASTIIQKEKALACLHKAGFGERLSTMPDGLDTHLYKNFDENGVEISGGEAQKIALARALYKDAPFIILDEPTAALDPIAEYEIYSKFNEIVGEHTAIYISHRLSSCRFCDDIAVFHEGKLVQRGSHEKLVTDETGKYYELWQAQAQYYH